MDVKHYFSLRRVAPKDLGLPEACAPCGFQAVRGTLLQHPSEATVRRLAIVVSSLISFSAPLATPAYAQQYSIEAGVVAVAPGVTVHVLREGSANSNYCAGFPRPPECDVSTSYGYLGIHPLMPFGVDAAGSGYGLPNGGGPYYLGDGDGYYVHRTRRDAVTEHVLFLYRERCLNPPTCSVGAYFYRSTPFFMDVTNGRMLILTTADIRSKPFDQPIDVRVGILEITGLPQLFDTLLTFVPGGQSISALTPAHPDGFRSADSLQVWTGNLRTLPDWSRAEPLVCNATENPTPGQLVTVADTLPDPAPGQGRYYITASQHAADRRLGRQYVNGGFTARDPSALPVCGL